LVSLVVVVIVGPVFRSDAFSDMALPRRVLAGVSVVFLPPALLLGGVSPLAAAWAIGLNRRLGSTLGALYATGSLGAIIGTLLTGFVLVSMFGTMQVVIGVGVAL